MIIMFNRSVLFDSSSNEFFLAAGANSSEVDTIISSFVLPDFHQLVEDLLVFDGQLEGLIDSSVLHDSADEVIARDVGNSVLLLGDVGDLHGSWGGGSIFILLVGEDINADNGGLGGSMFSRLGSGVLADLAWESLQHAVSTLLDATSCSGSAVGWAGFNFLEISLIVWHLLNQKYYVGIKSNS